jgi:hypothetical protein
LEEVSLNKKLGSRKVQSAVRRTYEDNKHILSSSEENFKTASKTRISNKNSDSKATPM